MNLISEQVTYSVLFRWHDVRHPRSPAYQTIWHVCMSTGMCWSKQGYKPSSTTTSRWQLRTVLATIRPSWRSCEYHLVPPHVLWWRMHWCRALTTTANSVVQPCLYFFWQANDDPALARIGCYPPTSVRSSVGHAWLQPWVSSLTATHCTASRVSSRWLMGGFLWLAR